MATHVVVGGTKIRLDPRHQIGEGGEAVVYGIAGGRALKVYKGPDHPELAGNPELEQGARQRLAIAQRKLPAFPPTPPLVVAPAELAYDAPGGSVVGFTMPLVAGADPLHRYSDRSFRERGVKAQRVVRVLSSLHGTLEALHHGGVVVGDLNDLNVLVESDRAWLIDADSFSFGAFECPVFTERFVDPLLIDPSTWTFAPGRRQHAGSDWYAFTAIAMQSLLLVGPWGGTHRPRPGHKPVPPHERAFRRLTVLDPDVRYPRPALPPETLPDGFLHYLHGVFVRDERGVFPARLLEELRFVVCPSCGLEHARSSCPACAPRSAAPATEVVRVTSGVVATRLFSTPGTILHAVSDGSSLRWLFAEGTRVRREDGRTVLDGVLEPDVRLGIAGERTIVARGGRLVVQGPEREPSGRPTDARALGIDCPGGDPAFAADGKRLCWVTGGRVWREGPLGPQPIGDGLAGQTRIWLGERLGLGLYRAGGMTVAFVFQPERTGICEIVGLPRMAGTWLSAHAVLGADRAWLLVRAQEGGSVRRHCVVLGRDGAILAVAEASDDGGLPNEGACAAGAALLSPTDDGIVRFETHCTHVARAKEFPSTRPHVDAASRLLVTSSGLHVIGPKTITRLELT